MHNIFAGAFGNVLEWYDFAVYGTLAPVLGSHFFPANDPYTSLLSAFGVFAVGYASRPVGGIVMGHIADRLGRKRSLIFSVVLMGVATTAIGLLPTYAEIGTSAAVLLIALRIVQGLSVGGEYPNSIVFLAEHASAGRRGFYASWPMFGSVVGFLLGSGLTALLTGLVGEEILAAWAWRIPFLAGAVIAVLGAVFRRTMTEPSSTRMDSSMTAPIVVAVRDYWQSILKIIGLTLVNAVGFYLLWVYATSYLTDLMHVSTARALDINTMSLIVMMPATIVAAMISDRIGRKPLLYFASLGTLILAWPLWWCMHHQNSTLIFFGQAGFAVLYGAGYAGLSVAIVEMLPGRVRCSASAIGYNICQGLFGGTTPLVATYLVQRTSDDFTPAYYLMAAAILSLFTVATLSETANKPLPE